MDIYATDFMRMFEHYWFRAHIKGHTKGSKAKLDKGETLGLTPDASWSDPYYAAGSSKMLDRLAFAELMTCAMPSRPPTTSA